MTPERFAEINELIRNYRKSRMGKPKLWALIGELANEVDGDLRLQNLKTTHPPIEVPIAMIAGLPVPTPQAATRSIKPETPSPGQWKRMTEDERTAHFLAVRAYDESLTPEERRAIEDADAAQEAERREKFAVYKEGFEDRPFVRPN